MTSRDSIFPAGRLGEMPPKKKEEHKTLLLKGRFGFWMQPPKAEQDRTKSYHSQSFIKARQFISLIETYQICF
jgi:hypothetical protein